MLSICLWFIFRESLIVKATDNGIKINNKNVGGLVLDGFYNLWKDKLLCDVKLMVIFFALYMLYTLQVKVIEDWSLHMLNNHDNAYIFHDEILSWSYSLWQTV